MMRAFWPLALVVVCVVAGAALAPGSWEMAFMKLRDRDFAAAERALEEKYLNGSRQREVLIPLSELYVRNGRIDKAIAVLRKYSTSAPGEKDVAERLAALLKEAQQMPQAAAQLERLAKDRPTAASLRELDRLYDIEDNVPARIAVLTRLVRLPEATPQEFFALTNLLAATDRKVNALTVAYNALKRWPSDCPLAMAQTFAALAIDTGRTDVIDAALAPWAARQTAAIPLNAVAATLIDKGAADKAAALVAGSAAARMEDPATVVLLARLMADRGERKNALARLDALDARGKLPNDAVPLYASVALSLNLPDPALRMIRNRGTAAFDDAVLLYAIAQTPAGARDKLAWLDQDLAAAAARPLPQARVALALGDRDRAAQLAAGARAALTPATAMSVAQLYADLGDIPSARAIFEAAAIDPASLPVFELGQAALVAIAVKDPGRALALTSRLIAAVKSADAKIAHARALALNARFDEAVSLLDEASSDAPETEIAKIEIYKAAGRTAELRDMLLQLLLRAELTEPRRTNYLFALNDLRGDLGVAASPLAAGLARELGDGAFKGPAQEARLSLLARIAPDQAIPFLKAAAEIDLARAGYSYAEALKSLKMTAELRRFLAHAAQTAKDPKLRDGYLYEFVKWGGAEALPLLAARAQGDGETWFYAYDAALKQHATSTARREALTRLAQNERLKPELRKQIAFQVLELGDTAAAERLFRALAQDAAPGSDVVRQLSYVWGPRPKPDAMAWLKARMTASPSIQQPEWAALVLNGGDAAAAIDALKGRNDLPAVLVLADAYVETKNAAALKGLIAQALVQGASARTADRLARAAEALSLNGVASRAYEAAAMADPKAWLAAGRSAFFAGDFSRAQTLLERSAAAKPQAQTWFYLGEALWAQRRRAEAAASYEKALASFGPAADERKLKLVALARLKRHRDAETELAAAAQSGDALDAQSAYAGALLDQGDTGRAAGVLGMTERP
jgi:uncharacterized protein HemY